MSELSSMTVNERLFHRDLIEDFDRAVHEVDVATLWRTLRSVELSDPNVYAVIKSRLPFLADAVIEQGQQA